MPEVGEAPRSSRRQTFVKGPEKVPDQLTTLSVYLQRLSFVVKDSMLAGLSWDQISQRAKALEVKTPHLKRRVGRVNDLLSEIVDVKDGLTLDEQQDLDMYRLHGMLFPNREVKQLMDGILTVRVYGRPEYIDPGVVDKRAIIDEEANKLLVDLKQPDLNHLRGLDEKDRKLNVSMFDVFGAVALGKVQLHLLQAADQNTKL